VAHRLEVGDLALELTHARGETDDATWAWWPARRVLFTGDLFFWVAPNAGNPQKVQRYAGEWASALRAMASRAAEVLVPGHGVPIVGAGRVRQALEDTAEWLETLERETVVRMNAGATLEQILAEVRPPAHLADRPYLQAVYDEPEFVVRNVWRLYGGWWDGIASHLKPASQASLGREVAGLAGGVPAVVARARALAAAGDLALAGHLIDWAAAASPDDHDAHAARAAIYERRAAAAEALMTRGIFAAVVGRVSAGRYPYAVEASPDGKRLFVGNVGIFQYAHLTPTNPTGDSNHDYPLGYPGTAYPDDMRNDKTIKIKKVDPRNLPDTLRDPEGIRVGYIDQDEIDYTIPGLGSPNAPESSSVYSFRLTASGALPVLEHIVKTGLRVGEVEKAIKCRYRSGEVVRLLANSLQQSDPVRSAIFLARATGTQPAHK
jgi:hypothetical protein